MQIADYLAEVQRIYNTGSATEHSYRAALGALFDRIDENVKSINEPKAMIRVGRPDFVFQRNAKSL